MTTDFLYEEFIMLSDDSFVFFSVKEDQAEIRPPLDSLNINVPLKVNVNVSIKQWVKNAAVGVLTGVSLTVIPPGVLAKTTDSIIVQKPPIAVVSDMGLSPKPQNSAPTFKWSQNASISNVAAVEKVDSNSTYSSAEETSLNVVNPKSKKSNTIKKKNKDSLLKSTVKNQEKSNSPKGLLKSVKIIAVGSMEFTNLVSEQPPVNQPAGQQLTQGSPNVGPDGLQPTEQRLAEEIFILTDVNEQCSKELLYQSSERGKGIIRDLKILDETFCVEGLTCQNNRDSVVEQTTKDLRAIRSGAGRLKDTSNKAMKLAQTVEEAWDAGNRICTTAIKNIGIILPEAEALPNLLECTYQVISPLRELLNSRLNHVLNPTITHKHERFGDAVRHVPNLVQSFNENQNPLDRFQVIYNLFQSQDFLTIQNPVIRYHNGIVPQKIVVGVIEGQNDKQASDLAKRISGLPGHVIHECIQQALVLNSINQVVPGAEPQSILLKLPANSLQNFPKANEFPVKVWSDTSHTCVPAESLEKIKPVAAVIMDKPDIIHPALVSARDNVNVNNSVLKGNLLVAARLKVDTKTPHLSGLVQADLFNLNHSNASLKDRLFFGASVDLLGAIGAKNNKPWLIEISAQKSVLSSAYRISLNVGCELGF